MSIVTFIDEDQAPPPRDGRGLKRSRNIDAQTKQCRSCNRVLPFRLFVSTGAFIKRIGRRCGSADCRDCLERQRRAAGVPQRMVKVNGRGEVYCSNCKRYRPSSEFKPHPNRNKLGGRQHWWAYCKPCVRELDRLRYRGTVATPEGRRAVMDQRTRRHRRQASADFRQRREFLASTIELLQRRGLTISAIARVTGVSLTNLYQYRKKATHRPTRPTIARFEQLLRLTMDWPVGEPAKRNRLPHPREEALARAMASTIAGNPLRGSWKERRSPKDGDEDGEE